MNVFICVDDGLGLAFNKRRQSRDRELVKYMMEEAGGKLYISSCSKLLFEGQEGRIAITENAAALDGDAYYFMELEDPAKYESQINRLYLCKWNRKYPADVRLSLDLGIFRLVSTREFPGSSHDKITVEVYER